MSKLKYLSLFSGIGAFEVALTRLNIPYDLVGFSEIDKYAIKSYCAMHDVSPEMNLGDIKNINEKDLPKDIDLITYGFPCQDISVAGGQIGLLNEDGELTRSGLFFDAFRIIKEAQPKVAIAENVKNLIGKRFESQFKTILNLLDNIGYNNYWKILNSKDFGVPQNRERVFIISIRKDIDNGFKFPVGTECDVCIDDILENNVDNKYYVKKERLNGAIFYPEKMDRKEIKIIGNLASGGAALVHTCDKWDCG